MKQLTADRLREVLHFDLATGVFTWRVDVGRWGRVKAGTRAGSLQKDLGYREIGIDGRNHREHRLAWLYVMGEWPPSEIDHRDGNRSNTKWENLRPATPSQNRQNRHAANTNSKSGLLGVTFHKRSGRWHARIWVDKKKISLRYHDTAQQAHKAYLSAKRELHPFNQL